MRYQLVLQFPASSINDYDEMIELEDAIMKSLGYLGKVDGHDMGSGEMNIFIHTDAPELAFEGIKMLLGTKDFPPDMKAAYRELNGNDYVILHPPGLTEFGVV